jgi:hypothetical protein
VQGNRPPSLREIGQEVSCISWGYIRSSPSFRNRPVAAAFPWERLRLSASTVDEIPSPPFQQRKTDSTSSPSQVFFPVSHFLTIEVPEALAEAWRKLPPERRSSVVDYATFLASQTSSNSLHEVDESVEAKWDQLLSDSKRTANFQRWAEESLSRGTPEPLDPAKL